MQPGCARPVYFMTFDLINYERSRYTNLRGTCSHSSGVSSGTERPFARIRCNPLVGLIADMISLSSSASLPLVRGPRSQRPPIRHLSVRVRASLRLGPVMRSLQLIAETG